MVTPLKPTAPDVDNHSENREAWARWLWMWHSLFFIIAVTATVFAFTQPEAADRRGWILAFVAVLCCWYALSVGWNRTRASAPYKLAYLIMGWLVWFALTYLNSAFMLMLFILFPHIFLSLDLIWASGSAVLLMLLTVLRQSELSKDGINTWLPVMVIATVVGVVLAYFIDSIIKESQARRQLIATLEATRRELAAAEREAGILQERQRLAGEIHDTLAQGFTSIVTHLEAADAAHTIDPARMQHHMQEAQRVARASLNEARRFVWELRPPALEKQSFEVAVRQLVDDWADSNRIPARVVITGIRKSLRPDHETVLVRVVQEALANIAKHAQAQQVIVTLSYMPDKLIVDIHDDGLGFDLNHRVTTRDGGFGLVNMQERVQQLQGKFSVESTVGEGTTIVAEIPLRE